MPTVFVDCDDTLVLYVNQDIPNPYGILKGHPFKPNWELLDRLKSFKGQIHIWSGGGRDYAREVAVLVMPRTLRYSVGNKGFNSDTFQVGDIIVDDQPYYFEALKDRGCKVFNPFEDWVL